MTISLGCHQLDRHAHLIGNLLNWDTSLGESGSDLRWNLFDLNSRDGVRCYGSGYRGDWTASPSGNDPTLSQWGTIGRSTAIRRWQSAQVKFILRSLWDVDVLGSFFSLSSRKLFGVDCLLDLSFRVLLSHDIVGFHVLISSIKDGRVLVEIRLLVSLIFFNLSLFVLEMIILFKFRASVDDTSILMSFVLWLSNDEG